MDRERGLLKKGGKNEWTVEEGLRVEGRAGMGEVKYDQGKATGAERETFARAIGSSKKRQPEPRQCPMPLGPPLGARCAGAP